MSIPLGANGNTFNYPEQQDTGWANDGTDWASAVSAALGSIGLGTTLTANAIIDLNSTSRGFLPPRMTEAQRDAISAPTIGLTVINTTSTTLDFYDGSAWQSIKITNTPAWTEDDVAPTALAVESRFFKTSGGTFSGNITAPVVTGSTSVDSPTVNTSTVKASTSGGLAIQSNSSTLIGTFGAGGGNNGTFEGGVNIKGVVGVGNGTTTLPSVHGDTDTNTGILFNTADTLKFVTNGETRFQIEPTGQIKAVYESTIGTDYNTTLHDGYLCRAWVNFNGTGTVAIRASGNVSTITDHGAGDYSANFTVAIPDANYAVSGSSKEADSGASDSFFRIAEVASNPNANSVRFIVGTPSGGSDANTVMIVIHR